MTFQPLFDGQHILFGVITFLEGLVDQNDRVSKGLDRSLKN
jgi:hypothetical protein